MTETIFGASTRPRNPSPAFSQFETTPLPIRLPSTAASGCSVDASSTCRAACLRLRRIRR
ncbi:MAG: hypothetical protein GX458_03410 [Phyllobacteriaceae bacterium]|nr:hypothetical protein [Phyllobacteriaceae bacterium]